MAKMRTLFGESLKRREARKRRANVAARAAACADANTLPPGIFLINDPIVIGPTDSRVVAPILLPNREWKNFEGIYPSRPIVARLRNALAVHAFTTYYALKNILDDPKEARHRVEKCAGMSWGWLREIAVEHLNGLTLFRDSADVERWARSKVEYLRANGLITRNRIDETVIGIELSSVGLLSFAYRRAQTIVAAIEDVQRFQESAKRKGIDVSLDEEVQRESHSRLSVAYNKPGWDSPIEDLLQIAMYADINPTAFWPQRNDLFATLFELARFVGRTNAGRDAVLNVNCHDLAVTIFRGNFHCGYDSGKVAADDLRTYLTRGFNPDEFINKIAEAKASGRLVYVTAVERQLILVDRVGPPPRHNARARGFFSLFSQRWKDFFRMNPSHTH